MTLFFLIGMILVLLGAGASMWLPSAPSVVQTNTFLKPIGSFLINNGSKVALAGLGLIALSVFVFKGRE
jgi:hypothetical protein